MEYIFVLVVLLVLLLLFLLLLFVLRSITYDFHYIFIVLNILYIFLTTQTSPLPLISFERVLQHSHNSIHHFRIAKPFLLCFLIPKKRHTCFHRCSPHRRSFLLVLPHAPMVQVIACCQRKRVHDKRVLLLLNHWYKRREHDKHQRFLIPTAPKQRSAVLKRIYHRVFVKRWIHFVASNLWCKVVKRSNAAKVTVNLREQRAKVVASSIVGEA